MQILFMDQWVLSLIHAYVVFALAVISPGPDFAVTLRTSIARGRKAGLFCAAGVASANAIHIFLVRFGLGPLITQNPIVYKVMLFAAALFLAYLGLKSILASRKKADSSSSEITQENNKGKNSFIEGFLVNIFNGKAIVFWISYFTILSVSELPKWIEIGFPILLVISLFIWFAFVAIVMSIKTVRQNYLKFENAFNLVMGLLLIALAVKIFVLALK